MNDWALSEIERMLANMVRVGTVAELDAGNARVKIQVAGLKTDWLPWTTSRAGGDRTWHAPEKGEQVLVISPYGDLGQAVVIPAIYQDAHAANGDSENVSRTTYKDGTIVEYDRETHAMATKMHGDGTMSVTIGSTAMQMTKDKISFSCGGSSLELSAAGVKLNGSRIDLN